MFDHVVSILALANSLASQPTSAHGGKGLMNALYSFCISGMYSFTCSVLIHKSLDIIGTK